MSFKLKRVRQCAKCPWKQSTYPHDIPNGYSEQLHKALVSTIARPGEVRIGGELQAFACHESPIGQETHCIGWLMNQLGPGNNIALRFQMMHCENIQDIQLDDWEFEHFQLNARPNYWRPSPAY